MTLKGAVAAVVTLLGSAETAQGLGANQKDWCPGIILKDACNFGGDCGSSPTWRKGERRMFMARDAEDGQAVLVEYRVGAIQADNVRLKKGCALPRYTD